MNIREQPLPSMNQGRRWKSAKGFCEGCRQNKTRPANARKGWRCEECKGERQ